MPTLPTVHINLAYFVELGNLPFPLLLGRLFLDGGWVFVVILAVQLAWYKWVESRQTKFMSGVTFCTLAIDVPRMNEQTPKAVEHIFTQLSGALSGPDRYEKYWEGVVQLWFSFEIVSIGGYVQFVVHCPTKFRDLVEAAFYAQYPEAEITEIADYAAKVPSRYPDPEWKAFGTEFVLKKPSYLPLRTWLQFEHTAAEDPFKDPLSGLLETLSAIRQGEQLWIQFILIPTDDSWRDEGEAAVDKMLGKSKPAPRSSLAWMTDIPAKLVDEFTTQTLGVAPFSGGAAAPGEKKPDQPKMPALSPGERGVLEAIQMKCSKIGFKCKLRVVYVGKRDVFSKGRVFSSLKGALGQFGALNMNSFKGYGNVTPKGDYFYQRWSEQSKVTSIVRKYRDRSTDGATPFVLNVEELATLYHFPMLGNKVPSVSKSDAKRSEPPAQLPTEDFIALRPFERIRPPESKPKPAPKEDADEGAPPSDLPFA